MAHMRAGEAGNEKGYVVKMTDDTLATPYKIMPGTRVRLESAYDGTSRRTGVMGCVPLNVLLSLSLSSFPARAFGRPGTRSQQQIEQVHLVSSAALFVPLMGASI